MFKWIIAIVVVGLIIVLGGIGACTKAFEGDDNSVRDRVVKVLDDHADDQRITSRNIRTSLQDKGISASDANNIADAYVDTRNTGASHEAIMDGLDGMNSRDVNKIEAVIDAIKDPNGGKSVAVTTPTTQATSVAGTQPPSGATGGSCQPGDKVATFPEGNNQHRIEVGGHGVQHVDFYPAPPIKAVSYIVQGIPNPDGIPAIWWGFGSIWEWNPPGCSYNFEKDATDYARARLDSGHSGLVIDLRGDKPRVVSKPDNMSQADVDRYLGYLKQGPGSNSTSSSSQQAAPAVVAPVYAPPAQPVVKPAAPAAPAPSCDGVRQPDATRPDGPNSVWTITGPAAANIWNPQVNNGAEEHILVPEGQTKTLTGYGGSWWKFPPGCAPK